MTDLAQFQAKFREAGNARFLDDELFGIQSPQQGRKPPSRDHAAHRNIVGKSLFSARREPEATRWRCF